MVCGCLIGMAWVANPQVGLPTNVKGAKIPVYVANQGEPVAILQIGQIHKGYQSRGFFRIGVLPMLVLDQVTLEIWNETRAPQALERLRRWRGGLGSKVVEIRELCIKTGDASDVWLRAKRARFGLHGELELLDDVTFLKDAKELRMTKASLQFTGEDAGRFQWDEQGKRRELKLFTRPK